MHIIDTQGDTIRYPHHKTVLFTLPSVERTTVANKRNWSYDQRIVRATVFPREEPLAADEDIEFNEEEDEEYEEEEDLDVGRGDPESATAHAKEVAIPPPPPFTHEMGGSSSLAVYMSLDPTFLQSFSNLQMEVSGLQEGFTGMRADLGRLFRRMDSIKEGVSYFQGFVDRKEKREHRRI